MKKLVFVLALLIGCDNTPGYEPGIQKRDAGVEAGPQDTSVRPKEDDFIYLYEATLMLGW